MTSFWRSQSAEAKSSTAAIVVEGARKVNGGRTRIASS